MLCVTAYIDCVQSYGPQGIQQQGREVAFGEEDRGSSRKHRQGTRGQKAEARSSECEWCNVTFVPMRGAVGKYCSWKCMNQHKTCGAHWLQCSSCMAKLGLGMAVVARMFRTSKQTVLREWRRAGISSQKPKCISWKHYAATEITWIKYDHYDAWMTEYKPRFFDWSCLVALEKNKERCRKYQSERFKNSSSSDSFRLKKVVRCRVYNALKRSLRNAKPRISERTTQLIGCSIEFLKQHLESKFKNGMGWHNYGHGWHIDHIVPLSSFNLLDSNQLATACHYTNLQPMWAVENLQKSDRITENRQLCLPMHVTC